MGVNHGKHVPLVRKVPWMHKTLTRHLRQKPLDDDIPLQMGQQEGHVLDMTAQRSAWKTAKVPVVVKQSRATSNACTP